MIPVVVCWNKAPTDNPAALAAAWSAYSGRVRTPAVAAKAAMEPAVKFLVASVGVPVMSLPMTLSEGVGVTVAYVLILDIFFFF